MKMIEVRTKITAGNKRSDACWAKRNQNAMDCAMGKGSQQLCAPNQVERVLMNCLISSGEPKWWVDFPGCDSQAACLDYVRALNKIPDSL